MLMPMHAHAHACLYASHARTHACIRYVGIASHARIPMHACVNLDKFYARLEIVPGALGKFRKC